MLSAASPLIVYAITLFTSAFLLFLVQPMIGKQILPKFGGAPAVWSTCMVFYQAVLLAGYSYAHFLTQRFSPRKQIMVHLAVLLVPVAIFVILPVGFAYKSLNPPTDQFPALWVLIILTLLIGLPFFVVSTSAPLFQRWFVQTGHEAAQDPYFLYAASNFGSMISLILYPFVIEMKLGLPAQGVLWMVGYGVLIGLAGWCGFMVLKQVPAEAEQDVRKAMEPKALAEEEAETNGMKALTDAPADGETETDEESITDKPAQIVVKSKKMRAKDRAKAATLEAITKEPDSPTGKQPPARDDSDRDESRPAVAVASGPDAIQYLRWVLLGFVPSSLMLGVTMYMSTDIAAVPLLWLIPLALYLLTFILVFSKTPDRLLNAILGVTVGRFSKDPEKMLKGATIHAVMVVLMPIIVLFMVFQMVSGRNLLPSSPIYWQFVAHLAVMFLVAMVCHGELARTRPSERHLTGFYLAMSVGGVLGGIFNALIAPVIFNTIAEYSLVLVVACMLLPPMWEESRTRFNRGVDLFLALALGGTGGYVLVLYLVKLFGLDWNKGAYSHLPDITGVPGMQIQVVGYLLIVAVIVAFAAYVLRAPKELRLERFLDLGLPVALCLLTMLIIGLEPFGRWTAVWREGEKNADYSRIFATVSSIAGIFRIKLGDDLLQAIFTYGIPVALCYGFAERPIRLGLGIGAILLASALQPQREDYGRYVDETVYKERSFFGVLKIEHQKFKYLDGETVKEKTVYHKLLHGTTLHGMQRVRWDIDEDAYSAVMVPLALGGGPLQVAAGFGHVAEQVYDPRQEALTYYHRTGPVGQVYKALVSGKDATRSVAFVGLGTGTMASYCNPGQKVTFYEIDQTVVQISENPENFSYLKGCRDRGGDYEFKMGDARLMLEKAPDKTYKLIVVDAFSSDAIPLHLITREAIELYLRKLADDGVVALHISNRHLELEPVLANIAADLGIPALEQYDNTVTAATPGKNASDWVIMARKMENFGPIQNDIWRWPQDDDRRWKNLVTQIDAQKLSAKDLEDWKRQHLVARETYELRQAQASFRVTEEFAEEAKKLVKDKVKATMDKEKKELEELKESEIRARIQREVDRLWDKDMDWRNDVGVWTDDYSNIISIWRDLRRR